MSLRRRALGPPPSASSGSASRPRSFSAVGRVPVNPANPDLPPPLPPSSPPTIIDQYEEGHKGHSHSTSDTFSPSPPSMRRGRAMSLSVIRPGRSAGTPTGASRSPHQKSLQQQFMSPSPPPPPGFMRSRASSVVDFSADGARQRSASMSVKGSEEGDEHRDLRERENGGERDLSVAPLPEGDESELVRLLQRDSMTLNEDGAELKQTLKLQAPVACVAFSQGGSLLAGGSRDGVVRIWNMDDTSVQHVLRGHRDRVWSLSFSPGGSQLASASWDKTVRLWDPRSGQLQHILKAHTRPVWSVVFSASGHLLLTGGLDDCVNVWDPRTGEHIDVLKHGVVHAVYCVAVSPREDLIVEGSFDSTMRLWSIGAGSRIHRKLEFIRQEAAKRELNLFRARRGQVNLRKAKESARQRKFEYFGTSAEGEEGMPEGRASSPKGEDEPLRILRGHRAPVISVEFNRSGSMLCSGSHDGTVALWDVKSWTVRYRLESISGSPVWSCHLSSDSSLLAMGCGDGSIDFWDPVQGSVLLTFKGHDSYIMDCAFSSDGLLLASASDDKCIRLWKLLPTSNLIKQCRKVLREARRKQQLDTRRQSEMSNLELNKQREKERRQHVLEAADHLLSQVAEEKVKTPQKKPSDSLHVARAPLDEHERARIEALRRLVAAREKALLRERHALNATERAASQTASRLAENSRHKLRRLALQKQQEELGLQPLAELHEPTRDMLYVHHLHKRLKELYHKVGRKPVGDTHVVRRVEELETYDLERQLHFEEVLLRSLRYEAFKPTTLDSLALKSIE